ncbi:hypothetical protein NDU88_009600 [Pleurodeles waltl]|uniref:Reverse transcriptase RNase H-like domain-containing protein n=1 Tax=Pleurodeles waltl TaxID=8319 RepID=A0AAV7PVC9_PLEWA|nr:hypothetical protein NDU88_009600 [Pleurodeles waltl]
MSRKLNEAEQNYVIAEKELLVIRGAFKEWRHHLLGAKYTVTVYTDHRNLQFMSYARLLTPQQLRWMLFFAEFDFVLTFWPGKDNRKADALSRQGSTTLPAFQASRAIIAPDKVLCIIKTEDFFEEIRNSFTVEKWQTWAQADPKRSIKQGLPFHDARLFVPTTKLRKIVFHWLHVIRTAGHPGKRPPEEGTLICHCQGRADPGSLQAGEHPLQEEVGGPAVLGKTSQQGRGAHQALIPLMLRILAVAYPDLDGHLKAAQQSQGDEYIYHIFDR